MSDCKSSNTSWQEVVISSKNEHVFIRNLSDLNLHITFDASRASLDVASTPHIHCNNCKHASSWRFYLHCGLEETGSPGIKYIVCHQVLRHPSEHGTSTMVNDLLGKAHIATLNQLTESEVSELTSSTVNETAFAIPNKPSSYVISKISCQRKF
jgi:hypothetical protein